MFVRISLVALWIIVLPSLALAEIVRDGTSVPDASQATGTPKLPQTALYEDIALGCHPVELAAWNHPTQAVLLKNKIRLASLELCNDNQYPIYHVSFPYDPMSGQTEHFFNLFYAAIFAANGHNPLAFVDTRDNEIVYLKKSAGGSLSVNYDQFFPEN